MTAMTTASSKPQSTTIDIYVLDVLEPVPLIGRHSRRKGLKGMLVLRPSRPVVCPTARASRPPLVSARQFW